ncbi:hypothetical protein [Candidatus Paracaedibacter symbiosus]|uniref:hypothetical protein n=1 Tax=Candidatus Paracaedibacter symbiosus TaxID=244582 RepID=UPI000509E287|nr:hypothetical protein [Candidatus Paracaedibacter symbiosus]
MKKFLLLTTVLLIAEVSTPVYSSDFDKEQIPSKPSILTPSISLRDTRSVKEKIKMFEEFSNDSSTKILPLGNLGHTQEEQRKITSTGHVSKIKRFFQRNKSREQLPIISQEPKKLSSTSSSIIISSTSPKSPRNLYNRLLKNNINMSKSLEELPKEEGLKSKKREKGSRSKTSQNFELSSPSVNITLTKQHTLNPENIEKDWEDRIKYFNMVKKTIEEHKKTGTIKQADEKYVYVLKGDLDELETMYVKGMSYLQGKHSLRKQDPMMVASHIQNMGNLLTTIGLEIYWVTGTGSLTIHQLALFETKLNDAKKKQEIMKSGGDEQDSLSKICITHPSPNRRRAHTDQGNIGSMASVKKSIS